MKSIQKFTHSILILIFTLVLFSPLYSQEKEGRDYIGEYKSGNYIKSLKIITKNLDDIYLERVETFRIPTNFITITEEEKEIDLKKLFRNRKAKGFFIEDNEKISMLHLYGGRCNFKLEKYRNSINHYMQALRFKVIELKKDDQIYYEISQVYKKYKKFKAYINALEAAHMIHPEQYSYSLELGKALYRTLKKELSIYHLERYITNTEDDIDSKLYLMIGNLYENTRRYLKTEFYYKKYLEKNSEDGNLHFALGYLAFKRTGNYTLSLISLNKALKLLPEKEIFKRSQAYEFKGDILFKDMEFKNAINSYLVTINYQNKILKKINTLKKEIKDLSGNINVLKKSLLRGQVFEEYDQYEELLSEKGKKELKLKDTQYQFRKLNAGRIRWVIAGTYERTEELQKAITYYRESIKYQYKANKARKKIIKLKLKIKRGY